MSPMQEDPDLAPWRGLGETLAGSFAARGRGTLILAPEFAIEGREGGRSGDLQARIERSAPAAYMMLAGGTKILAAGAVGSLSTPEIRCSGRLYRGRLSLLRNTAEAGQAGDEAKVRITGGLTNRNYEAVFDTGDLGSLPVAFFLLYLTVALRSEAYITGARSS